MEQINNALPMRGKFKDGGIGKIGLTVTIDIWKNDVLIIDNQLCTEIGRGYYKYILTVGNVDEVGEYYFTMKTGSLSVDSNEIEGVWIAGRAGIENLDETISSRASQTVLDVVRKYQSNKMVIHNNQLRVYDDNGTDIIRTFNLFNASGDPAEKSIFTREPV